MSDRVLVTFAALAEAAQQIQSTYNNLNTKLTDLESQLKPVVSTWTGNASQNYQVQQQVERRADRPQHGSAGDRQGARGRARRLHHDRDLEHHGVAVRAGASARVVGMSISARRFSYGHRVVPAGQFVER